LKKVSKVGMIEIFMVLINILTMVVGSIYSILISIPYIILVTASIINIIFLLSINKINTTVYLIESIITTSLLVCMFPLIDIFVNVYSLIGIQFDLYDYFELFLIIPYDTVYALLPPYNNIFNISFIAASVLGIAKEAYNIKKEYLILVIIVIISVLVSVFLIYVMELDYSISIIIDIYYLTFFYISVFMIIFWTYLLITTIFAILTHIGIKIFTTNNRKKYNIIIVK